MQERNRVAAGYGLLGLTIGLFLFPWVYLVGTRTETLTVGSPVGATLLIGLIFVPAVAGLVLGRSKGERTPA